MEGVLSVEKIIHPTYFPYELGSLRYDAKRRTFMTRIKSRQNCIVEDKFILYIKNRYFSLSHITLEGITYRAQKFCLQTKNEKIQLTAVELLCKKFPVDVEIYLKQIARCTLNDTAIFIVMVNIVGGLVQETSIKHNIPGKVSVTVDKQKNPVRRPVINKPVCKPVQRTVTKKPIVKTNNRPEIRPKQAPLQRNDSKDRKKCVVPEMTCEEFMISTIKEVCNDEGIDIEFVGDLLAMIDNKKCEQEVMPRFPNIPLIEPFESSGLTNELHRIDDNINYVKKQFVLMKRQKIDMTTAMRKTLRILVCFYKKYKLLSIDYENLVSAHSETVKTNVTLSAKLMSINNKLDEIRCD